MKNKICEIIAWKYKQYSHACPSENDYESIWWNPENDIPKPSLYEIEQVDSEYSSFLQIKSFENLKNSKISQLKLNLELQNNKPCLVKVGDVEFLIKKEDEITIGRRIKRLSALPSGSTAEWSNSSNERLDLTLPQFEELLRTLQNHLDVRDEQNFAIYFPIKKEIEAALTIEELNDININFN